MIGLLTLQFPPGSSVTPFSGAAAVLAAVTVVPTAVVDTRAPGPVRD